MAAGGGDHRFMQALRSEPGSGRGGMLRQTGLAQGTLIATRRGSVAVEDLGPEDRLLTRDAGYRRLVGARPAAGPDLQVCALVVRDLGWCFGGSGTLELRVAPGQGILCFPPRRDRAAGGAEVLVPAHRLAVRTTQANRAAMWHLHLDEHQIILANGHWVESQFPAWGRKKGAAPLPARPYLDRDQATAVG